MTNKKMYLSMCAMDNGDIMLAVYMTRCNRPRCDLLVYSFENDDVYLCKESVYLKKHPDAAIDPQKTFDEPAMEEYACVAQTACTVLIICF
jgi:hypothetical protein